MVQITRDLKASILAWIIRTLLSMIRIHMTFQVARTSFIPQTDFRVRASNETKTKCLLKIPFPAPGRFFYPPAQPSVSEWSALDPSLTNSPYSSLPIEIPNKVMFSLSKQIILEIVLILHT
jgi:hypothetical protein